jgi:hypothetical protein
MIRAISLQHRHSGDALAWQACLRDFLHAFHRDVTCLGIGGDQCGVMWVPADPAMLESGAIQCVRDSHHATEH